MTLQASIPAGQTVRVLGALPGAPSVRKCLALRMSVPNGVGGSVELLDDGGAVLFNSLFFLNGLGYASRIRCSVSDVPWFEIAGGGGLRVVNNTTGAIAFTALFSA